MSQKNDAQAARLVRYAIRLAQVATMRRPVASRPHDMYRSGTHRTVPYGAHMLARLTAGALAMEAVHHIYGTTHTNPDDLIAEYQRRDWTQAADAVRSGLDSDDTAGADLANEARSAQIDHAFSAWDQAPGVMTEQRLIESLDEQVSDDPDRVRTAMTMQEVLDDARAQGVSDTELAQVGDIATPNEARFSLDHVQATNVEELGADIADTMGLEDTVEL